MSSEAVKTAANWLSRFSSALSSQNVDSVLSCFCTDGWFRDVLVFTWDNRSLQGIDKIREYLAPSLSIRQISDLELDLRPGLLPVEGPISPWATGISSGFTFATPIATGMGYFQIQQVNGEWKAFLVTMVLDELKGHEEAGAEEGVYHGNAMSWGETLQDRKSKVEQDLHVLIIGGAQTGLNVGARFKQMGIPSLIVEAHTRIGDNWRQRYNSLSLHTIRKHHSMLYTPYPSNWPVYTPRDKLADWLEQYAISQDLVVWTASRVMPTPKYDSVSRRWSVTVNRNGILHQLHPSHIVLATGTQGDPFMPDNTPGLELFKGQVLHASAYRTGRAYSGKRVVVVGAGNTGADVCQDLCTQSAAQVTMVQRSSTAVVKRSTIGTILERSFPPHLPLDICDFLYFVTPLRLFKKILASSEKENWRMEQDIHEKLRKGGLALNMGSDGSGPFPMVFERFGGYWLDVGAADLIGSGKIKVKQGVEIAKFTEDSVVFTDESSLQADVVIFATGYRNIRECNIELFGAEAISRTGPVWGMDEEGELKGCYRPSGHPGLWYAAGDFSNSRFSSKHLGIQIKAIELGLLEC